MTRLIMLAALLLSVVGGLILISGASPLAAQAGPSAMRSFDSAEVAPGGTVMVTITGATAPGHGYGNVTGRLRLCCCSLDDWPYF